MIYLYMLKKAWHFAKNSRKMFIMVYITNAIGMVFAMARPYIDGKFFNALQIGGEDIWHNAFFWVSVLMIFHFIHIVLWYLSHNIAEKVSLDIKRNVTDEYYDTFTKLPMNWHVNNHSGTTIARISQSVDGTSTFINRQPRLIKCFFWFAGSIFMLFAFSWKIAILSLILGTSILAGMMYMDIKKQHYIKNVNTEDQRFHSTLMDGVTNIKTIITLKISDTIKKSIISQIDKVKAVNLKVIKLNRHKWSFFDFGNFTMIYFIIFFYAWGEYRENQYILMGNVFAVYQYLKSLQNFFIEFGAEYQDLIEMKVKTDEINPLLDEYNKTHTEANSVENFNNINISNLCFAYQNADRKKKMEFKGINLDINKGQKIAFIGESGSGKSTILGILAGLFSEVKANVMLDKKKNNINSISNFAMLLPQEPEIFENSIKYNIDLDVKHSKTNINKAISMARFDEVLKNSHCSLKTDAKEKGLNLSGGEKQRLALARGILAMKDREIILLDEPTSSIDKHNENMIYDAILNEFSEKTIIAAIHNLNLIKKFDYVYVFSKGKIIEHGSPDELKKQDGYFAEMIKKFK